MANYIYRAKNRNGEIVSGVLVGESRTLVIDRLIGMGLTPVELSSRDISESKLSRSYKTRRRIKKSDITLFMRQLADLLSAGVPLTRALNTLAKQQSNLKWKESINQIKNTVIAGSNLADAMAEYPKLFSELQINLIRSGEISGNLESVLSRIAEFSEKEESLLTRVKTALAYPILLLLVGTASVIFLMVFFIPQFTTLFNDLGQSLPLATRMLISISQWLSEWWYILFLTIGGGIIIFRRWISSKRGKYKFDEIKLAIPVIRDIVVKLAVSRFCRTLGTLLASGIPLLTALKVVKGAAGNEVISSEIGDISESIREGQSLSEPLELSKVFPPAVVEMIAVGEEAGNLETVLIKIAESYDMEVDNAVRVFVSLFEPVLIIFMACIIGFIVISMLLPVFTINSMIQ